MNKQPPNPVAELHERIVLAAIEGDFDKLVALAKLLGEDHPITRAIRRKVAIEG